MEVKHLIIEREFSDKSSSSVFMVNNTISGRFIRLGILELKYLLQTLKAEEEVRLLQIEEVDELPDSLKSQLDDKFEEWGFLREDCTNIKHRKRISDLSKIKILSFNAEKLINTIYPFYSKFFGRLGIVLLVTVLLADIFVFSLFLLSSSGVSQENISLAFNVKDIIISILLLMLCTAAHELGHAVVCKKYGGKVKSMGLLLFFFFPCFYCDVSEIYGIHNKRQRAMVALAGILSNIFLGLVTFLLALILLFFDIVPMSLYYFFISCFWVSFYNLIPFVKLDGYWVLSAALGVTNLMDKGFIAAYTTLFDRRNITNINMTAAKRRLIAIYGILSFLFKPIFWGYNLYIVNNYIDYMPQARLFIIIPGIFLILWDFVMNIKRYSRMLKMDYKRLLSMMT